MGCSLATSSIDSYPSSPGIETLLDPIYISWVLVPFYPQVTFVLPGHKGPIRYKAQASSKRPGGPGCPGYQ